MISDKVEIDTLSYQEGAEAAHWVCDGSSDYKLSKGKRETRGTTITMNVSETEKRAYNLKDFVTRKTNLYINKAKKQRNKHTHTQCPPMKIFMVDIPMKKKKMI